MIRNKSSKFEPDKSVLKRYFAGADLPSPSERLNKSSSSKSSTPSKSSSGSKGIQMDPKIVKCTCKNEFQDKQYGNMMRIANEVKNKSKWGGSYRCTVCGRVHA